MTTTATPRQALPTSPPAGYGHCYVPWLAPLREDRAWTTQDLAAAADIGEPTIRRAEAGGAVKFWTLRRLARALRVSTQVLTAPATLLEDAGMGVAPGAYAQTQTLP